MSEKKKIDTRVEQIPNLNLIIEVCRLFIIRNDAASEGGRVR